MSGNDRRSWLCPDDARRERVVDMEQRLRPVRALAMGVLLVELIATGSWIGWWPGIICVLVAIGFHLTDRRLDRFARPELAIACMWAVTQSAIAGAVLMTGGYDSPNIAWLVLAIVTLPARFDERVTILGVAFTAALMGAVTILPDPAAFLDSPAPVLAPMALLVAVACLSTALMRSDIHHRTESVIDGLTGMLNRRALAIRAAELSGQARITGEPVGMIIGDLDRFKRINDEHGHAAGDAVLVDVAYTLRKELRAFDLAYRLGGEEFLVLLPGATLRESAQLGERLRRAVEDTPAGGLQVTMSFGVTSSGGGEFDHAALLAAADEALYEAKHAGRNRVALAGRPLHAVEPVRA